MDDYDKAMIYGWVDETDFNNIPDLSNGISVNVIKSIQYPHDHGGARCRPERWLVENYFLGICIKY